MRFISHFGGDLGTCRRHERTRFFLKQIVVPSPFHFLNTLKQHRDVFNFTLVVTSEHVIDMSGQGFFNTNSGPKSIPFFAYIKTTPRCVSLHTLVVT